MKHGLIEVKRLPHPIMRAAIIWIIQGLLLNQKYNQENRYTWKIWTKIFVKPKNLKPKFLLNRILNHLAWFEIKCLIQKVGMSGYLKHTGPALKPKVIWSTQGPPWSQRFAWEVRSPWAGSPAKAAGAAERSWSRRWCCRPLVSWTGTHIHRIRHPAC